MPCPATTADREHNPEHGHRAHQQSSVTPPAIAAPVAQRSAALQQRLARVAPRPILRNLLSTVLGQAENLPHSCGRHAPLELASGEAARPTRENSSAIFAPTT